MYTTALSFLLITVLPILTLVKFVVSDTLIKDTKQSGKVIRTIQPCGIKMCAKHCFCENRCQSFNFEQDTLSCEILPTEDSSLYINTEGYIHSNIAKWSKDVVGKCEINHCSVEERYVPLRNGGVKCIKIGCVGIRYTYDNDTGLCYHIYHYLKTWTKASEHCQEEGGRLIVLDTQEKIDYFPPVEYNSSLYLPLSTPNSKIHLIWHNNEGLDCFKFLRNYRISIGLADSETEGTFKWVTGSALTRNKFAKSQPNDYDTAYSGKSADCVSSLGNYWYDDNCQRQQKYACERPDLSLK